MDAFAFGTRTTPEDSYRYAMGEPVEYFGKQWKRLAPLDFLAVTDHAEYLGTVRESLNPNGPFAKSEWYTAMTSSDPKVSGQAFQKLLGSTMANTPIPEFNNPDLRAAAWESYAAIPDRYYKPGKFTSFVGFEWTSMPQAQNLHRCVIFADKGPALPYTAFQSVEPEDLWRYLEGERKLGLDVIAVPHNGNVSNGLMFATRDLSGKPLTREYAERRMANEPLVEIIQAKGQSDTDPALSPNDEFADFEIWKYLLDGSGVAKSATGSYIRQAYGVGQELQAKLGVNPFKYGIEAGTDFHSGIDSTEPSNYAGSHGNQDADPQAVVTATKSVVGEPPTALSSGGLTGVWAEENHGRRLVGSDRHRWSDLFAACREGPAERGNLDRIQVIKITTKNGKSTEKIFDAVWSGDRKPNPKTGTVPAVGNTVDLKTASYTSNIGAVELLGEWTDPWFDPNAYTTYYARVLEIPTPRWSTYRSAKLNMPPNPNVPAFVQQRAWTSPIWYTPAK